MGEGDLANAAERVLRFVGEDVVGMVVGVVAGDKELIVSRGRVSADGVFDVGSITKLFTALLLADMASRSEVGLDDPLDRFLPAGVRAPRWQGREITLLDLATHTSGLPRLPRNLLVRATLHGSDPYRGYTLEDLHRGLAATRLRRPPGSGYCYSNFGFAVLGDALALAVGAGYEQLVVDRVCGALTLGETAFKLNSELASRRENGHGGRGQPVPDWDLAAFAPAGGLRSTMRDMVRFLRVNLEPGCTELATALEDAQRRRRPIGGTEEIGLAWHLRQDSGTTVAWHNGGTGGFGGFVAIGRERRTGIAILYNSPPSAAVDAAAFGLLSDLSR
jgi:CubicO group peptidase (beta-lactamase class C family)